MNDNNVWEIPYGTKDLLPQEAAAKRALETKLMGLFADFGYAEVVTPTIEYLDTLGQGSGLAAEHHMFKLFDRRNHTLALRHEMTTPLARLAATRMKDAPQPLKLSYAGSVFRYEQAQRGRQCEFHQAGVELMGSKAAVADAEVIALSIESLKQAGLKGFSLCLGQVEFAAGLVAQYQLQPEEEAAVKTAMENRDLVGLAKLTESLNISSQGKEALQSIPLLQGGVEVLDAAYDLALNPQSRRALDNLREIYELLRAYGVEKFLRFDLGILRDVNYYTGMVFEAYAMDLGFPLCGGGRYDGLLSAFGSPAPATGFALGLERVLLALERQGAVVAIKTPLTLVAYGPGKEGEAIAKAQEIRAGGGRAEMMLSPQSEEEANLIAARRGLKDLVYVK